MPSYDFRSLSPLDFEELVRDLLQEELGVLMESFAAGRDGGVDLRRIADGEGHLVVQCKHYARSGLAGLLRSLKTERSKVEALSPDRYLVATSVPLTPANKATIRERMAPHVKADGDVLGADDLNNLLGRHGRVETRHFKLWLTSTALLERLLHAEIHLRNEIVAHDIRSKLPLYVQNRSYDEALAVLNQNRYCLVVGPPGVGKTTLAEALIASHVARGYRFVVVRADASDALRALRIEDEKVIILYDDFLGQTMLGALMEKNEDSELLGLLRHVQRSEHLRMILTTREYILIDAKKKHERLHTSGFDLHRCTVTLDAYTRGDKAAILFNHVYFSDLGESRIEALLTRHAYRRIVDHPAFVPRIVEWMTGKASREGEAGEYVEQFVRMLDRPEDLWDHAFRTVSDAARHLLLVLATLPPVVLLDTLHEAFRPFHRTRVGQYRLTERPGEFKEALRELEGTFVSTGRLHHGDGTTVRFHNPSIRGYVEALLRADDALRDDLTAKVIAFEQLESALTCESAFTPEAWRAAKRVFNAPSASLYTFRTTDGADRNLAPRAPDLLLRAARLARWSKDSEVADAEQALTHALAEATSHLTRLVEGGGITDLDSLGVMLDSLDGHWASASAPDALWITTTEAYVTSAAKLDDFQGFCTHAQRHPGAVQLSDVEVVRRGFTFSIHQEVDALHGDADGQDPEYLREYGQNAAKIAGWLGAEADPAWGPMLNEAAEFAEFAQREMAARKTDSPSTQSSTHLDSNEHIDSMFETLRGRSLGDE